MESAKSVSSIMTSSIVTLNVTDSLIQADILFKKHKIRHLPVMENGGKLVGMLSLTDLTKISLAELNEDDSVIGMTLYNMFSLEQVMTKNLITVEVDDTIESVAKILAEKDFRALPVMAGKVLVGILTTTDLIRYLLDNMKKTL